ncbi:solute:sodium symporter family transporter [Butyricicoccus pullicaecorum]|uniref:Solute:sodium symporter (SSS) family transporter n=1 Tax=Butyricicoccus pullicaecorum 1.2 TaxID=1203606 RepID=R8W695_9FIRM|nr:solute:sodium symporter family transporter [Butyricicoccus pullicaecorum]EOQ40066.1 solute:sodium symporter (SSS) family transporter [Butyricicoccus pullicaecorum 1.2]SKA68382.1 solute:Na+ symporter, SSS family [Butyricicoccus pullicaecorum DSM 23266]
MAFTLITFVFFTVLVAVISYVKTKGDDQTTSTGYFLAGRGLPGVVIAGSLLLTNLSAEQLVGTNGQTWAVGMSPMAFEVMAATALIVLALFAAPRYLKSGITTIPELIGERFDRGTKLWFSIAYIILYLFVQIPVILYSGSLVFENIFHLSSLLGITKFQSIVILCILITIIGSIYAIFGGLKAVAVSDTINGVGLLIGGLMIPFIALHVLGNLAGSDGIAIVDGFRYLMDNHADMLNSIAPAESVAPAVPWPTVFLGLVFLGFQSWCTHQSFIQRVLAAENLKEAQKGALYCAFLKIMGFMFLALPGVISYAIFELQGTQVSMMDDAYPALVSQIVPQPLMGFFAAVMFGAILSSFNSVLNSVSTMYTMDIYKEFINKDASELKLVSVGKNMGIVFAVFSVIVGPLVYFFPAGLKTFLDSFVMLIGLPVLSAVFGGFFFKYLPKYTAKFIMVFHIICYGGFMLIAPSYSLLGGGDGEIHYLYAVSILWPIELLIMFFMNRSNKNKGVQAWVQKDVGAVDMTPWKYSKIVSVIVLVCVVLVYLAFSPLGIGAW